MKKVYEEVYNGMQIRTQPDLEAHCSIYALVNILQEEGFLEYINDDNSELSKDEENELLGQLYPELSISAVMYINTRYGRTLNKEESIYTLTHEFKEEVEYRKDTKVVTYAPYLLTVKPWTSDDQEAYHRVAALFDGHSFYYMDSILGRAVAIYKDMAIDLFDYFEGIYHIDRLTIKKEYKWATLKVHR